MRSALVMALIWLTTVAGVAATAWYAIDRAGRDISVADASPPVIPSLGPPVDTTTPTSGSTSTPATSGPPASATTTTTTTGPPSSTAIPTPSAPSQTTASSPAPHDRTVIVAGGRVSVRCIGADLTLRITQPDDGWRVAFKRAGAGEVGVTFQPGDDDATGSTNVQAVCSAGTPVFKVVNTG